ncbi:MAG: hypothetical protein V1911_01010 [Candidatus Micrarchaeota archaeon]
MVTHYKVGYQLEHRARKVLEKNGWLVVRSPASKSETDLFATKNGENLFVQCKKTMNDRMSISGMDEILAVSRKYKAVPVLAYSFKGSPVYAVEITKNSYSLRAQGRENQKLEKYLIQRELNNEYDNMMAV